MLNKLKNRINKTDNKGFTIIEVMIVLAIAGLIILIVLLAVPALQRSGRNTATKNDASAVTAAINEFKSNNDGLAPAHVHGTGTVTACDAATCTNAVTAATGKMQGSTVVTDQGSSSTGPGATIVTNGEVWVYHNVRCDGNSSSRAVAVWYPVETSGASVNKCIDS